MASATITLSNRLKYDLVLKRVDFSNDVIKACLVRSGFIFNPDTHHYAQNLRGSITSAFTFMTSTITMVGGTGFSGEFVSGQAVTVSGTTSYDGSYVLFSATDSILYVTGVSWVSALSAAVTIQIQDELLTGNGYTRNDMMMSGVFISEDDASDVVSITWTLNTSWTATGGSIGPTPGMLMVNDTWSTIIGYISFASAEIVGLSNALVVNGVIIRVN
jgi:hypothetical protein